MPDWVRCIQVVFCVDCSCSPRCVNRLLYGDVSIFGENKAAGLGKLAACDDAALCHFFNYPRDTFSELDFSCIDR